MYGAKDLWVLNAPYSSPLGVMVSCSWVIMAAYECSWVFLSYLECLSSWTVLTKEFYFSKLHPSSILAKSWSRLRQIMTNWLVFESTWTGCWKMSKTEILCALEAKENKRYRIEAEEFWGMGMENDELMVWNWGSIGEGWGWTFDVQCLRILTMPRQLLIHKFLFIFYRKASYFEDI